MIFSKRKELAEKVDRFMKENNIMADTFGAICALEIMGHFKGSVDEALDAFYLGQKLGIPHHNCFNHAYKCIDGPTYMCSICSKMLTLEQMDINGNNIVHDCAKYSKFSPLDDLLECSICGKQSECTHPRGYFKQNGDQVCAICAEVVYKANDLHYKWGDHHWAVKNGKPMSNGIPTCILFRDGVKVGMIHESITTLAQLRLVAKGWEHRNAGNK